MTDGSMPADYVPFSTVRASLPDPTRIGVGDGIELETLNVPGPSPALVFVHGGLGSLWNPYPQLAAFEGERELVTYALAGNGNSTPRPTQSLPGHVADLASLLDELGIRRPIVHGHSYGTALAIEFAKRYPTAGLVLHAGGDHDLTPSWERPLLRVFLALGLYRLPANDALLRGLAHRVGFHETTPTAVVADFLRSNPQPRRRSAWRTVTEAFWGYDGRADIHLVDVPTLVIHGPADGIVPLAVARGTARRLPAGLCCRVQRTGHMSMIERPRAYNRLLRGLLDAVQRHRPLQEAVRERLAAVG